MKTIIRRAVNTDIDSIFLLYKKVSSVEGGLARNKNEITGEYISYFVDKSIRYGVIYVAIDEETKDIIGEIHCYSQGIDVFAHVLGELTIAVDNDYQGKGIGRGLFQKLLETIINEMPEILRIELIARESNIKAIRFYETLGFKIEGKFINRIKSVGDGYEADIPMAWLRQQIK